MKTTEQIRKEIFEKLKEIRENVTSLELKLKTIEIENDIKINELNNEISYNK